MVMTPSLPTTFMAPAMMSPISLSPLAEIAPTWATALSSTGLESLPREPPSVQTPSLSREPMITVTAFSMPRFRAVGFAPAATADGKDGSRCRRRYLRGIFVVRGGSQLIQTTIPGALREGNQGGNGFQLDRCLIGRV